MNNIPEVAGVSVVFLFYVFCAFFALIPLFVWKQTTDELLILTLTEHEVMIHGKNLELITEPLSKSTGLHLRVKEDRYQSLLQPDANLITQITIKPNAKSQSIPAQSDQS